MKIRIKGNSVRYRITQSELKAFATHGMIEESTCFGPSTMHYKLLTKESNDGLSATFENNTVTMFMPKADADVWTSTERITYDNKMDIGASETMYLLLEKDFVCLDHTHEDQSDMFPNPNKHC